MGIFIGPVPQWGKEVHGERKWRKRKDDLFNDPAIASDEFYDEVIVLAVTLMCFGSTVFKDCSDRNPAGSLKELLG